MPEPGQPVSDLPNYQPGSYGYASQRVRDAIKRATGRDADVNEINSYLGGGRSIQQSNIDHALRNISSSEEARNYARANPYTGQTAPPTNTGGTPPPAGGTGTTPPPSDGTTPRTYTTTPYTDRGSGSGGSVQFAGYDFNQSDQNRLIGKSAKYTTAEGIRRAIEDQGADRESYKTKEGAQKFAEQYLKNWLEENGMEVLEIVGDKMFIRDHEDRAAGRPGSWVDWVINADGPGAIAGWQVENNRANFGPLETAFPSSLPAAPGAAPGQSGTASAPLPGVNDFAYEHLARPPDEDERRLSELPYI